MTNEDRIRVLHTRVAAMRRARERRKTGAIGAASAALTMCLLFIILGDREISPGGMAGLYCGSSMLFEGAGPYVLIAIIAFMAGVVITVLLKRQQGRHDQNKSKSIDYLQDDSLLTAAGGKKEEPEEIKKMDHTGGTP